MIKNVHPKMNGKDTVSDEVKTDFSYLQHSPTSINAATFER